MRGTPSLCRGNEKNRLTGSQGVVYFVTRLIEGMDKMIVRNLCCACSCPGRGRVPAGEWRVLEGGS